MKIYNGRDSNDVAYDDKYGRLVDSYTFPDSTAGEYEFTGLDITTDGGVYDVTIIGRMSGGSQFGERVYITYNGEETLADYSGNITNTQGATVSSVEFNYPGFGWMNNSNNGASNDPGVIEGTVTYNPVNSTASCESKTSLYAYSDGDHVNRALMVEFDSNISNITSIKIWTPTLNFIAGTKILIWKKGQ